MQSTSTTSVSATATFYYPVLWADFNQCEPGDLWTSVAAWVSTAWPLLPGTHVVLRDDDGLEFHAAVTKVKPVPGAPRCIVEALRLVWVGYGEMHHDRLLATRNTEWLNQGQRVMTSDHEGNYCEGTVESFDGRLAWIDPDWSTWNPSR